jgi:hypothetical protein
VTSLIGSLPHQQRQQFVDALQGALDVETIAAAFAYATFGGDINIVSGLQAADAGGHRLP